MKRLDRSTAGRAPARPALVATLLAVLLAAPASAQMRPPGGGGGGWSPVIGVRAGWSMRDSSPLVGASLRIPLPIPLVRPSLIGSGDLIFQDGLTERLALLDLVVGLAPTVYAGGGPAWLNSVYEVEEPRRTEMGFSLVAGARGRLGPVASEVQFRWLRVDRFKPSFLSLGFTYPVRALLGGR